MPMTDAMAMSQADGDAGATGQTVAALAPIPPPRPGYQASSAKCPGRNPRPATPRGGCTAESGAEHMVAGGVLSNSLRISHPARADLAMVPAGTEKIEINSPPAVLVASRRRRSARADTPLLEKRIAAPGHSSVVAPKQRHGNRGHPGYATTGGATHAMEMTTARA